MQKRVNLGDLVKSFQTSNCYLLANIGFDTAVNWPLREFAEREHPFLYGRKNEHRENNNGKCQENKEKERPSSATALILLGSKLC